MMGGCWSMGYMGGGRRGAQWSSLGPGEGTGIGFDAHDGDRRSQTEVEVDAAARGLCATMEGGRSFSGQGFLSGKGEKEEMMSD